MSTLFPVSAGVSTAKVVVEDARQQDMAAVQAIYAPHVLQGLATFEEQPPDVDEMARRREAVIALGLPFLVARQGGAVVGYCYAGLYGSRSAFRYCLEDSIYVDAHCHGRGIGHALLQELIARCEQGPWRQMIAVVGHSGNAGSIALHASLGFQHMGVLRSVGYKLGQWVDIVLMQRQLGLGDASRPCD